MWTDEQRKVHKPRVGRYPSDVSDEEWAFVAPYLALCREDAQQRKYSLREVFNGLRYVVRTGVQWRMVPHDLPPWTVIYQQAQRWIRAQCFQVMIEDLRMLLREFAGRKEQPRAMVLDSRTLQSTPESVPAVRSRGRGVGSAPPRQSCARLPNDGAGGQSRVWLAYV